MALKKIEVPELEQLIVGEEFVVQGTMTICTLTLACGYRLVGHAAAMSEEWFNEAIGRTISRDRAFEQLWALEGYRRMWQAHDEAKAVLGTHAVSAH